MDTAGRPVYSEVLMFMDRDAAQQREFVRIDTEGGANVTVTPGHLVYVRKRGTAETRYMFADRVEEGDHLLVATADGRELVPRRVRRIGAELHRGVFAPLTREGTIVVDDVTASCYAMVNRQWLAHWSFAPVRAWRTMQRWLDWGSSGEGLLRGSTSSRLEDGGGAEAARTETTTATTATIVTSSGMHWYAYALYSIKGLLVPSDWMYHT